MRILLSRTRVGVGAPTYAYRVHVPFTEISLERQALIAMQSDYGLGAGLLARLADVIAPMAHHQSAPGLDKHKLARCIDDLAAHLGAIVLRAAFREMREAILPFRLTVPSAPPDARLFARIANLSGAYERLARERNSLTAVGLGLELERDQ